jgi:hypothetical protein
MKRAIKLIILFSLVTILPSVAVADVIIGGTFTGSATSSTPPVTFEPGSNYLQAQELGLIHWSPSKSYMGSLQLNGSLLVNETLANVLDLNSSYESVVGATIFVNITTTNFSKGVMYLTKTPMNLTEVSTGTFPSGVLVGQEPLTGVGSISFSNTASGAQFYIGFYLPYGNYAGTSLTITVQYVATGGS